MKRSGIFEFVERVTRRTPLRAVILVVLLAGCSHKQAPVGASDPKTARAKVTGALPSGWTAVDANWQQQSDTVAFFSDPRTEAFALVGPQSRHGTSESQGQQQRDDLYKECLFVWIVPGDFNPSFPQPPTGTRIALTNLSPVPGVRVYADVSNYIVDSNRWHELVRNTGENGGSIAQPIPRVSWASWAEDIAAALQK